MAVGIFRQESFTKAQTLIVERDDARRDEARAVRQQSLRKQFGGVDDQGGLPVQQVRRTRVGRNGPPVTRRKVLEKLDAWPPAAGSKTRNAYPCAEDVVEMFLLGAVILTRTRDVQPERIAIKLQARFRVAHYDRRVIDSQKQLVFPLPF